MNRKQYYQIHKEKENKQSRQWKKEHPNYDKQYYIDNKEKIKGRTKLWCKNHPTHIKDYMRQWRKDNREKKNKYNNQLQKSKYKVDLKYNLNCRISALIRQSLKGNKAGKHWEDLVGYTLEDLMKRLKSTMPEGYNWEDYLEGRLHVDHKIPISAFNYTKPEHSDFKRCWALSNLRLLSAKENRTKGAKLLKPFQPSLAI